MNISEIKRRVFCAMQMLTLQDSSLILRDISERAIVHQLAVKLSMLFKEYNVDCEYNGNVSERGDIRKRIDVLVGELNEIHDKRDRTGLPDESIKSLSVFPDVIIHKRLTNSNNLLIIEAKKSTCTDSDAIKFDNLKMKYFTETYDGRQKPFVYNYGLLITFDCLRRSGRHKLEWFENGVISEIEHFDFNF